jgi:very-short-patch-repair endonuclease
MVEQATDASFMEGYHKNCPRCNKIIKFNTFSGFWKSKKYNRNCKSCSTSIINFNRTKEDKLKRNASIKSRALGRSPSSETRIKMSIIRKGKSMPVGTGEKISKALKGKPKSDDHKLKLRCAKIKDLQSKFGKQLGPNYNSTACKLFEDINKKFGLSGKHAENGGEVMVIGYWLDFYDPVINLAIEYDEVGHKYKKEKDMKRQKEIVNELGCKFIRINEADDLKTIYNKIKEVIQ